MPRKDRRYFEYCLIRQHKHRFNIPDLPIRQHKHRVNIPDLPNQANPVHLHALSFIHLFAKLAIEFNSFDDEERGGLLIKDQDGDNVFENLACATYLVEGKDYHHADDVISTEWIRLRQMGLMKKDDIRKYNLFYSACHPYDIIENCIRFLVEWDPEYLFQIDRQGIAPLPFQVVAECSSNRYFRLLFEYFIRYYPYKKGISNLFRTNEFGVLVKSPFNVACGGSSDPTQRKRIMDIIEEALA